MAATELDPDQLRKGAKVVATTDLRGVPEGTPGKVMLVAGLSWIRYWVRFDNGVQLGSIDRSKLATKDDLERDDELTAGDGGLDEGGSGDVAAADEGGGITTANGTFVSQKHIDRAKAARARLTGG